MRLFFILGVALLSTACSNVHFSSNVDKENFETYFAPSSVVVYEKDDLEDLDFQVLGAVEGSSCQTKDNAVPADIREARTKARIHAADLNANGVVFQSCISFKEDKTCITNVICYGRALNVMKDEDGK
jgi:RcsF protein